MAEFVEIDLEKGIHELEALIALNLFEPSEVKKFARQRRDNLYNLKKRVKDKNDFLRYIQFEEDLVKNIRRQRKITGIKNRKGEVEVKILIRLQSFFRFAVERYKSDLELWMKYFEFSKRNRQFESGNRMLQRLLQVHGDKPKMWAFACQWSVFPRVKKGKKDYGTGRTWLVKGIERHPKNQELYKALIKLDLDIIKETDENKKLTDSEKEEKIKTSKACVDVSYRNAVKAIQDPKFNADIVNLISEYPHCEDLVKKAMSDLEADFQTSEESWASRALWALKNASPPEPLEDLDQLDRYRKDESIQIFNSALDKIPTKLMYEKYINFLTDMISEYPDSLHPNFKFILYKTVLPAAMEKNLASPKHIQLLADFQLTRPGKEGKALESLRKGVELFPEHVPIWYELIRAHLVTGQDQEASSVFREAIQKLKHLPAKEIVKLWTLIIGYLSQDNVNNKEEIEKLYQEGMRYKPEVAELLKQKFLQWRMVSGGLEAARGLISDPVVANPPSLGFFQMMIEIEMAQPVLDLARIRQCYETVLRVFGPKDADPWLSFIKFEKESGHAKQVVKLYQRAVNNLCPEQVDVFTTKYSLMF